MANKLSFSQIRMYTECGHKYSLHYKKGYREKYFHSALGFGSAIDEGLNTLVPLRDLDKAIEAFHKTWNHQYINKVYTDLSKSELMVYAERDFDEELLDKEADAKLASAKVFMLPDAEGTLWPDVYKSLKEKKETVGFDNFTTEERQFYNYANWLCLRRKGEVMIESFYEEILPNITECIVVQHKFKLENAEGEEVIAVADMIVRWHDGRILLMDNKTSAREYDGDQASRSQQLLIYHYALKDEFNLDPAVGFIVMNKNINKNKVKLCPKCGVDGTGNRSRTCPQEYPGMVTKRGKEVEGMVRCDGEWLEHINPKCFIQVIINDVTETASDHVLDSFDQAAEGIRKEYYYKNLTACKSGPIICPFFKHCWSADDSDIVKTKE